MGHSAKILKEERLVLSARPEVILVGDSHVLALAQGCEALGRNAAMLKSGGIHWNQGKIRVYRPNRERSPFMPAMQGQVNDLEAQMDTTDIFDGSVPVIASIGFHCGHLTRAFGAHGHVAWPPPDGLSDQETEEALFASNAAVAAFVEDRRQRHFRLLSYIASRCRLTAILPPRAPKNETKIRFRHNLDALTDAITVRLESRGIDVYDPNTEFVEQDKLLPWDWVNDDGFHGTPEYGKSVVQTLIARGAFDRVANEQKEK